MILDFEILAVDFYVELILNVHELHNLRAAETLLSWFVPDNLPGGNVDVLGHFLLLVHELDPLD